MRIVLLAFFLVFAFDKVNSQTNTSSDLPWLKMIEDPNVNYYEAIKCYENYWKNHSKPELDEDRLETQPGQHPNLDQNASIKLITREELMEREDESRLAFACKKFEHWVTFNKPFVQPDGKVLTAQERYDLWQKSKKDRH